MTKSILKMADTKRLTGLLVAAIVISGVFWLGKQPRLYIVEQQKLSNAPDFFLEGVQSRSFNSAGALQETLTAETAKHYQAQQLSEFEAPTIRHITQDSMFVASGKKGFIKDNARSFTLEGSASVVRHQHGAESARIESDSITYYDATQTILAEGHGELKSAQGTTQSDTITFNLAEDNAILTGGVTSHYEATQH